MNQQELEDMYIDLVNPTILIEHFEDDKDFLDWLRMGTIEEMGWALKAFVREELYHHCNLIKKEMKDAKKPIK